ncbi:hypothetical protein AHiyo8_43590 [Arthrobacter sp. Hiyo8]|nr:hypothetical protein AHiyo8_43590 [Arthrobacter sp. Hiyo8]
MTFAHVGVLASSRSASHTLAPEFRALMAILAGEAGPVISTRRSCRATGASATFQSPSRMSWVSGRKSRRPVRATSSRLATRAARSSVRVPAKRRCSSSTKANALGVRISSARSIGRGL